VWLGSVLVLSVNVEMIGNEIIGTKLAEVAHRTEIRGAHMIGVIVLGKIG
jgi:hypothetical protein